MLEKLLTGMNLLNNTDFSFNLDIKNYPEVINNLEMSTLNFYLQAYYKHHKERLKSPTKSLSFENSHLEMPLWKVEDLLQNIPKVIKNQ